MDQKRILVGLSGLLLALIFTIDIITPHGWADFIFYFLPIVVYLFTPYQWVPLLAASLITIFVVIGYFLSPPGTDLLLAVTNRSYALVAVWIVAFIIRTAIQARNLAVRQSWIITGRALVAESLKGELSATELMANAITALAKHMRADVGVIYAAINSSNEFAYSAGYSVPPEVANRMQNLQLGVGAVGQAALDQKVRQIDFPQSNEALQITSTLGSFTPRHSLIAPMGTNNEVNAIIELGLSSKPHEASPELLAGISDIVSLAIKSAQNREKLRELLDETQRMAEELQAQQEELRVSNEELEHQSRALQESQVRLENNQAELEQSNQQLEEQMQELERQKKALNEKNDDLIRVQIELEKNRDDLARSTRYKSEFLANMSHELRTPLNSSLILAKLLMENREGNLNPEQLRFAETIHTAGSDLLNLINDILDLSKIEAGKLQIHPERVSLKALINSLEKYFLPVAKEKGIGFRTQLSPEAPQDIITDRQRLEQILKNFLSNAFKFTDKGDVSLTFKPAEEGLQIEVVDTGIGIAKDQQQIIFEAFQQADGTANRRYGGTGLGLSISRELTNLLGGRITLKSEPGVGSNFTLTLPLEFKQREDSKKVPPPVPEIVEPVRSSRPPAEKRKELAFPDDRSNLSNKRRVLIIEDDPNFSRILFDLAHEMDFEALVASSANEGLDLAGEYSPQAILLDVRLPDHSGMTVLDQLKRSAKTRHIPVHMISGHDFSRTALHMGAAGYLLKPVDREQLVNAFKTLVQKMDSVRRVLIVEDNDIQRESMISLISDKGIDILSAGSAEEALKKLETVSVDCIIMDLSLPGMSGLEMLETLYSREPFEHNLPPVIVYTGRDLTNEEELQLKRYSDSIIVKGARSPERLLSEVTLFLHRVEAELPLERQKMLFDLRNREKTLENKSILIVDDDVRNIFALSSLLESQGAQVEIARNGKESLTKLSAHPDIDLVLMDIMMPEMDGYEATRRIREQSKFAKLPIIAVTAKAMQDDQEKCLEAGANDYLSKPIDSDKLLSLVRVWLPTTRGNQHRT